VRPLLLAAVAALAFAGAAARWALTAFNFYDPLTAGLLGIALFTFMTVRESGKARVLPAVDAIVGGMSKISYSLYLVHLSVLFYAAAWFPALVGHVWMLPLVFILCNGVAILFYLLFERHYPAVRRRMEPWLGSRREVAPARA
jgi:peptidoglycan/LPS O-acetylase OafA/YrhL